MELVNKYENSLTNYWRVHPLPSLLPIKEKGFVNGRDEVCCPDGEFILQTWDWKEANITYRS